MFGRKKSYRDRRRSGFDVAGPQNFFCISPRTQENHFAPLHRNSRIGPKGLGRASNEWYRLPNLSKVTCILEALRRSTAGVGIHPLQRGTKIALDICLNLDQESKGYSC